MNNCSFYRWNVNWEDMLQSNIEPDPFWRRIPQIGDAFSHIIGRQNDQIIDTRTVASGRA